METKSTTFWTAFEAGKQAFKGGLLHTYNPFPTGTFSYINWRQGWQSEVRKLRGANNG